jgi:hypothetical protein
MPKELTEEEKQANLDAGLNEDGTPKEDPKDPPKEKTAEEIAFEKRVEEEAKKIAKDNLDKAYAERDRLKKERDDLAKAARDRELKELEDQGKHAEAAQRREAEAIARAEAAEARIVKLERDQKVRDALADVEFRNARARETAFNSIVSELIQDDQQDWVHKSGASIAAYVKTFVEDEDNDFLLKPKPSTGGGADKLKTDRDTPAPKKKLGEMTSAELIAHYANKRRK